MKKTAIIGTTETISALKYYDENYDIIPIPCPDKLTFIETKKEYVCRFCSKDKTQTTFRKKAHAIPELLGNKTLCSKNECDACNEHFGRHLEDHLAKYLMPYNSLMQIVGKNKVPKYKDSEMRIESENGKPHIKHKNSKNVQFDLKNKTLNIQMQTQKLIPIRVYKAFLKMALSVMPEDELVNFDETIKYVCEEDKDRVSKGLSAMLVTFTPGVKPYDKIMNIVLKRKNENPEVPYMQYVLAYGNFIFQIMIPSLKKDEFLFKNKKTITIKPFPSCYDFIFEDSPYNSIIESETKKVNLSSINPTIIPMSFRVNFDSTTVVKEKQNDENQ